MEQFNFKQWLMDNRMGAYSKASLRESLDVDGAFGDDNVNRDDLKELNPAALGVGQAVADREMQKQDDMKGDWVDNVSMDVTAETVGWANIEKPADGGVDAYLDKVNNHDFYYKMSDDSRKFDKGEQEKAELKQIYAQLSDEDKQRALDAYRDRAEYWYPEKEYPLFAQRLKTLTTKSFEGA